FSPSQLDQREDFDINDLVEGLVSAFRHDLLRFKQSPTSKLEVKRSKEPLVCSLYRRPFEQTVRNIIINAFQALADKEKGNVRVSMASEARDSSGVAAIAIEDNGIGIAEKDRPRIFEGGYTTQQRGSGVGLWL